MRYLACKNFHVLINLIYDWILDNHLTPYVMVDAMMPNVAVPERFIEDGKIILMETGATPLSDDYKLVGQE